MLNELKQSKEEMQLQEKRMKALGFSDIDIWKEEADLQITEDEAEQLELEKQAQKEQKTKVDSDFFTDEAKKQLEMEFGCFRAYDSENGACQCCCLKDECKRVTDEDTELGWDE